MRILLKNLIILISFAFLPSILLSQNINTDSLETIYEQTNDSIKKINILLTLGQKYENTKTNTSLVYYDKANFIAKKIKNKKLICKTYYKVGTVFEIKSKLDTALAFYNKGLALALKINDTFSIANNYNGIGNINYYKSQLTNAITNYQKAIDYFKLLPNSDKYVGVVSHNIGMILQDSDQPDKAFAYYNSALNIFIKTKNYQMLATCYNSIASNYINTNDKEKALVNYKKAIKYAILTNDLYTQELIYNNIGKFYIQKPNYQLAIEYIIKAESIALEINDDYGLTDIYISLSRLYIKTKDYYKSRTYAIKALKYSKKTKSLENIKSSYLYLKINSSKIQDYKSAYYYSDSLQMFRDSIMKISRVKDISNIEAKYQNNQKQLKIENLEKQAKLDNEKFQKQRILTISFIIGSLLIIIFLFFIIKALNKIKIKNQELNIKTVEIISQRDEIESQRDAVLKQKLQIELINTEISQSIEYAKKIQTSILPEQETLKKHISDNFIFFKPKDVVSGDFYWWSYIDNHTIISVADCTGHGVPGAFMSMLGISLLREIVNKEYITHTSIILKRLRKEIIKTLKQKGVRGEQKDGMDMAIISINNETNIMQFSGANNPIYIVTNSKLELLNNNTNTLLFENKFENNIKNSKLLYELKPDKMPISIYEKMDKFSTYEIQLKKGDQIYMFSDGFADQFGGTNGKKFKYKPFKKLLLENANLPMIKQKEIIFETFKQWKGELSQIDDIIIVGLKI